jgi:hypothetical protein
MIIFVVAITTIVNYSILLSTYKISPSPSPIIGNSPTSTATISSPSATILPTANPSPTYALWGTQYQNSADIYVTGIQVQGGDLHGTSINWGTIYVGSSKNVSFRVQSTSNIPIKLSYNITNWAPSEIGSYLNLVWNYNETQIEPNQELLLTLTLTAPLSDEFENYLITNNITAFSFNLNVYAINPK